jgi:hypothetical protein
MTAPQPDSKRPGLREQLRRTRAAAMALATAHLELLKAELAAIGAQIKGIAALVGGIVALLLFALSLLAIGGVLFLGEWLFGSIGWGVLHGLLLSLGGIVAMALLILDVPRVLVTRSLLWALAIGALVSVGLGLNLARDASERAADYVMANVIPNLDRAWAPVVVAAVAVGVVLSIVGVVVGARSGGRGAVGGLVLGLVVGALVGAFLGGVTFEGRVGVALGVVVGAVAWPALMAVGAARSGIDPAARFGKLWPRETYETALGTKAWLEQEWTKRRQRLSDR